MFSILEEIEKFLKNTNIKFDSLRIPNICFNRHFMLSFIGIFNFKIYKRINEHTFDDKNISYFLKYDSNQKLFLEVKYVDNDGNDYHIIIYHDSVVYVENGTSDKCKLEFKNKENPVNCNLDSEEDIILLAVANNANKNVRNRIKDEVLSDRSHNSFDNCDKIVNSMIFKKTVNYLIVRKNNVISESDEYTGKIFVNECVRNILLAIMHFYFNNPSFVSSPISVMYHSFKDQMKDFNFEYLIKDEEGYIDLSKFESVQAIINFSLGKSFLIKARKLNDMDYISILEYVDSKPVPICIVEITKKLYQDCGRDNYLLSLFICLLRFSSLGDTLRNDINYCSVNNPSVPVKKRI